MNRAQLDRLDNDSAQIHEELGVDSNTAVLVAAILELADACVAPRHQIGGKPFASTGGSARP